MLVGYKKVMVAWDERRKRQMILVLIRNPGRARPIVVISMSANRLHRVYGRRTGSIMASILSKEHHLYPTFDSPHRREAVSRDDPVEPVHYASETGRQGDRLT